MVSSERNIVNLIFDVLNNTQYEMSVDIKYTGVALEGKAATKVQFYLFKY